MTYIIFSVSVTSHVSTCYAVSRKLEPHTPVTCEDQLKLAMVKEQWRTLTQDKCLLVRVGQS